jgi:hypothetical protein
MASRYSIPTWFRFFFILLVTGSIASFYENYQSKNDETTRDENGEVIKSGEVGIFSLKVGDCFQFTSDDFASKEDNLPLSLPVVPCTDLHDGEVISVFDLPYGLYPTNYEFKKIQDEKCWDEYELYTKTNLEETPHLMQLFYPLEESWNDGNREVTCTVSLPDGERLGASVRG